MRPSLLIGLILAASSGASAMAATATPPAISPPPAVAKDGVEVIILPTMAPASGPETTVQATLDVEARTDDALKRLGFRSLRAVAAVNCVTGENRFITAEIHDQPDLQGPIRAGRVSGQWVHPTPDSFMFAATQTICAGLAAASAPPPTVVAAASPPEAPAASPSSPPPKPAKTVKPKHPPAAAPATPVVVAAATPAPKPAPPAPTPTPPPAAAVVTPPPVAAAGPRPFARAVAQVAASPTAKQAQHVLDALKGLIAPPLSGSVEAAEVKGAKVFRASVLGFVSTGEARAFCAKAASVSKTCWVRPLPAGKAG